jgi:hypothetical protein
MNVTMYRKHDPNNCKSKDTQVCKNQCPIWIRGAGPDGRYVRGPVNKTIRGKAHRLNTTGTVQPRLWTPGRTEKR